MQRSDSIAQLAEALCNAQSKFPLVKRDAENPFFRSRYADLASIIEAIQPALAANGLSVTQLPSTDIEQQCVVINTILMHSSGEYLGSEFRIPVPDWKAQGLGSATTYARRYSLQAILNIASDSDDDGNAASRPSNGGPKQKAAQRPNAGELIALKKTAVDICKLLNKAGDELTWSAKQLDEFAVQQYGLKADALELEPMRELVKKLQLRLDGLKRKIAKPKEEDRESVERADAIKRIRAANQKQGWDEGDLARYVAEKWETDIDSAPLDLLNEIYESLKTETAEF